MQADGTVAAVAGFVCCGCCFGCCGGGCEQMEFGKRMQQTESGEERKRMAMEFHGASTAAERAALEQETREMMQAVCSSPRAESALFTSTCAKLQTRI